MEYTPPSQFCNHGGFIPAHRPGHSPPIFVKQAGIDQLDTAGNLSYLGRYATKFLRTGRYLPRAHKSLAMAQGIHVVELPGCTVRQGAPEQEQRRLIQSVRMALAGR